VTGRDNGGNPGRGKKDIWLNRWGLRETRGRHLFGPRLPCPPDLILCCIRWNQRNHCFVQAKRPFTAPILDSATLESQDLRLADQLWLLATYLNMTATSYSRIETLRPSSVLILYFTCLASDGKAC
jgi:hypothetical protein